MQLVLDQFFLFFFSKREMGLPEKKKNFKGIKELQFDKK